MQLSFGDSEDIGGRQCTRREVFLAEMDQVVPWKALLALVEPHYPKLGRPGRQPYALATMLRIRFLQQWYALSDPAMEEALIDTAVMRRFAQLGRLADVFDYIEMFYNPKRRHSSSGDLSPVEFERRYAQRRS